MRYRVLYAAQFHRQLGEQLDYFARENAPAEIVSNWLTELLMLIDGLEQSPRRLSVADVESRIEGIELRRVVFAQYLIFYHVNDDLLQVQVYGFRHSARLP